MEDINKTKSDSSISNNILCMDCNKKEYDNLSKQYIDSIRYTKPEYSLYMQYISEIFDNLYTKFDVKDELDFYLPDSCNEEENNEFIKQYINLTIPKDSLTSINSIFNNLNNNSSNKTNSNNVLTSNASITIKQFFNYIGNKINELKVNILSKVAEFITKQQDNNEKLNKELIEYEKQKDKLLQEYNKQLKNKKKNKNLLFEDDNIVYDEEYGPKYQNIIKTIHSKIFDPEYNNNIKILKELLDKYCSSPENQTKDNAREIISYVSSININQTKIIKQYQKILENIVEEIEKITQQCLNTNNKDNNNEKMSNFAKHMCDTYKTAIRQFDKLYYIGSKLSSRLDVFHNKLMRTLNIFQKYFQQHEILNNKKYLYIAKSVIDYETDMYFTDKFSFKKLLNPNNIKLNKISDKTNNIDDKVNKKVDDKLNNIDDKSSKVGNKLNENNDTIKKVDNKISNIDDKANNIGDNLNKIDNKLSKTNNETNKVDNQSKRFREILHNLFLKTDERYYLPMGSVFLPNVIEAINIAYDKAKQQTIESLVANHTSLGERYPEDIISCYNEPITCYLKIAHHLIQFSQAINDPYLDYIEAFCTIYDFLILPGFRPERVYKSGESSYENIETVFDNRDRHFINYEIEDEKASEISSKKYFKLKQIE